MTEKCKICKQKLTKIFTGLYDNRHGYPGKFNIKQCLSCGFMQTDPQYSSKKLTEIYTNYYPKRDADIKAVVKYSMNIPSKAEIAKNGWETTCHFQTKRKQKVMDVGCGTCQSLLEIKRLGGEAWGIDPDKNSQKVAKKLKLKFHLGTIHNCKFPVNYFHLITASQVLEHEPDPVRFLKDSKKFLRKDGTIIMSFPNTGALFNKIWGRNWLHWHIPYHLNHFNKRSVELIAEKSGFEIVSIKTITPNLWTILQIRSVINNPKMGKRDGMWDPGGSTAKRAEPSLFSSFLARVLPIVQNLLFINRFIDSLGLGESFVVQLRILR